MLLARRAKGDKARARELLADAIVEADALGMPVLAERARALVPAGPAGPGEAPPRHHHRLTRRQGQTPHFIPLHEGV